MIKYFLTPLAVLFLSAGLSLNALDISSFNIEEEDGEAEIGFCSLFEIENIEQKQTNLGPVLVLPKEEGTYTNISFLTPQITQKVLECFADFCQIQPSCAKEPKLKLLNAKKIGEARVRIEVSFDEELSAIFFISTYQKKNKTIYVLDTPQDFTFKSKKYQKKIRAWLIEVATPLL